MFPVFLFSVHFCDFERIHRTNLVLSSNRELGTNCNEIDLLCHGNMGGIPTLQMRLPRMACTMSRTCFNLQLEGTTLRTSAEVLILLLKRDLRTVSNSHLPLRLIPVNRKGFVARQNELILRGFFLPSNHSQCKFGPRMFSSFCRETRGNLIPRDPSLVHSFTPPSWQSSSPPLQPASQPRGRRGSA